MSTPRPAASFPRLGLLAVAILALLTIARPAPVAAQETESKPDSSPPPREVAVPRAAPPARSAPPPARATAPPPSRTQAPQPSRAAAPPPERSSAAEPPSRDRGRETAAQAPRDRAVERRDPATRAGADDQAQRRGRDRRDGSSDRTVPRVERPRGDRADVGVAVPRRGRPPRDNDDYYRRYYTYRPYGYYSYYAPWSFGSYFYYDPFWWGAYSPSYVPAPYYGGNYGYVGYVRLKVKPRDAQVYVDGYYVGVVDEYDGIFQRLNMDVGPHRIEVRHPEYETLAFEVRVQPDETITWKGKLVRR